MRRYAQAASAEELIIANPLGRTSTLKSHKVYLRQRWNEGCTNTTQLLAEIRERGFLGSPRTLRRYTAQLRAEFTEPTPASTPTPTVAPKARDVVGWIVRDPGTLTTDEHTAIDDISDRCEELAVTRKFVADFATMVCNLGGAALDAWATRVESGPVRGLRTFATGLRKDWAAVTAGLTLPFSSGAVEGNATRIKAIKRQMYGRAKTDLLRRRILLSN